MRWRWPVLRSLDGYRPSWVKRDLTAGVLIVAIAIPLSMGMAEVAGMPPVAGLYACLLPLVAYALLGSSRQLVIALDASTAAMVAAAVGPLAGGDAARYATLVAGLAVITGAILVAAATLRLGILADFLSEPVLLGYQAGLAIVVISSQLPKMTGIATDADSVMGRTVDIVTHLGEANLPTATIAIGSIVLYVAIRRWRPTVPGPLIVLVASTVLVVAFDLTAHGVAVLGAIPSGLPPLASPDLSWADVRSLLGPAAAIALLAAADTLVSSRAFAARNGYTVSGNADLVGLGVANVSAGVSGGITVSASAARTAVAESVGSRSQVAGLSAAGLMLLVLAFLTPLLRNVPSATLGAVVTVAVVRLIEPASLRQLWRVRRTEFVVAVVAFLGVALIGVLQGVVIAMALSLADFLRRTSKPRDAILGRVPGRAGYHDVARHPEALTDTGIVVYRFDAPLFYANAERFRARVRRLAARSDVDWVVIDASAIADVDASALRMLGELEDELHARGVALLFADSVGAVKDRFASAGLSARLRSRLYDTIEAAVTARPEPRADWGDA
ncbi:MAG: SulP family inorganic anion transporter [Planctomycetaceae bacterium]